jgi:AAA-like domain/WD domain, G-beta repeat
MPITSGSTCVAKQNIYTVGGTVQARGGLYLPRKADAELLALCRAGTFAYVLTSRQMGKSSLMVHTAERLAEGDIHTVIINLTQLGIQLTAAEWYLGFLTLIADSLMLETDVISWWQVHAHLGVTQRLTRFLQEVGLAEGKTPVVIFVDEIDTTLNLPFTDDFYAAIRYLYNARALVSEYQRLSVVLIGVATPSDLISDPQRTPFNIGQRVDLTDFTFEKALPLADGLSLPPDKTRDVLHRVLHWTGGHPYLTQRLCYALAEQKRESWSEADVDNVVTSTFFGEKSEQDHNLRFVRDMLTKRAPSPMSVLATYREIHSGRHPVHDEEQSLVKAHLKLSGIVRREQDTLRVRNPIYAEVFDQRWVQEHWPVNWIKRIPPAVLGLIASLLVIVVLLAMFARTQQQLAQQQQEAAKDRAFVKEQKRLRLISLSQALAARALRKHDDQGALMARQAYLFHQRTQGHVLDQMDDALRTILSSPNFSHVLRGHEDWVWSVAFSADGQSLASGSKDKTVRLWALRQPTAAPTVLRGHEDEVRSVAFSADGQSLASGSSDQTILIWIARTETLAGKICQQVWRNLTLAEWRQFVGEDLPYERTCPTLLAEEGVPAEALGTTP